MASKNKFALSAVFITILFWASAYPAIRVGLTAFSPGQLASLRFLVATAIFAIYLAWTRPTLPRGIHLARIALAGALGIAAYNLLLNYGELKVNAGTASFLISCIPVFSALLAVAFLGERMSGMGWLGVAISFAGMVIIALGSETGIHFSTGALLVVGAAFCSAVMNLLQKPLLRHYTAPAVTACLMASGAALLSPFLPGALHVALQPHARGALGAALFLGAGPAALGYLAWTVVLHRFSLSQAASMLYFIPLVTVLISFLWIHERPSLLSLLGGVVAIMGVVLLNMYGKPRVIRAGTRVIPTGNETAQ